jgi:bifunctional ADP-heptose synthase (sugar kinase/adenylyltransferase)
LDTRIKIIALEQALERAAAQGRAAVVTGYFDPLTVEHAVRLTQLRRDRDLLIVVLSEARDSVLDVRARAELLAALEVVDYVVLPQECDAFVLFEQIEGTAVLHEETADEARFQRLVEHVHARHNLPVSHES